MIKKRIIFNVSETVTVVGVVGFSDLSKEDRSVASIRFSDLYRLFKSEPNGEYIGVSTAYLSLFTNKTNKQIIDATKDAEPDNDKINELMQTVGNLLIKQGNNILKECHHE